MGVGVADGGGPAAAAGGGGGGRGGWHAATVARRKGSEINVTAVPIWGHCAAGGFDLRGDTRQPLSSTLQPYRCSSTLPVSHAHSTHFPTRLTPSPPHSSPLPLTFPHLPPLTNPPTHAHLQAKGGQVDMEVHDDRSLLALQGPEAVAVLQVCCVCLAAERERECECLDREEGGRAHIITLPGCACACVVWCSVRGGWACWGACFWRVPPLRFLVARLNHRNPHASNLVPVLCPFAVSCVAAATRERYGPGQGVLLQLPQAGHQGHPLLPHTHGVRQGGREARGLGGWEGVDVWRTTQRSAAQRSTARPVLPPSQLPSSGTCQLYCHSAVPRSVACPRSPRTAPTSPAPPPLLQVHRRGRL